MIDVVLHKYDDQWKLIKYIVSVDTKYAKRVGNWGYTRPIKQLNGKEIEFGTGWRVIHWPSGLKIRELNTIKEAKALATYMDAHCTLTSDDPEFMMRRENAFDIVLPILRQWKELNDIPQSI